MNLYYIKKYYNH